MNDQSMDVEKEKQEGQKKNQRPKRYHLYDQININENYLDYFIMGAVILLLVILIIGVL